MMRRDGSIRRNYRSIPIWPGLQEIRTRISILRLLTKTLGTTFSRYMADWRSFGPSTTAKELFTILNWWRYALSSCNNQKYRKYRKQMKNYGRNNTITSSKLRKLAYHLVGKSNSLPISCPDSMIVTWLCGSSSHVWLIGMSKLAWFRQSGRKILILSVGQ